MTLRSSVPHPLKTAGRAVSVRVGSATAGARQLPSFVLVGAQRAGTTSLFRALMSHPLVYSANYHKGVNYFDLNYGGLSLAGLSQSITSFGFSLPLPAVGHVFSGFEFLGLLLVTAIPFGLYDLIEALDNVGIKKFPVYIHNHRHSHAAIVVRMDKSSFDEGRIVIKHWLDNFEL